MINKFIVNLLNLNNLSINFYYFLNLENNLNGVVEFSSNYKFIKNNDNVIFLLFYKNLLNSLKIWKNILIFYLIYRLYIFCYRNI